MSSYHNTVILLFDKSLKHIEAGFHTRHFIQAFELRRRFFSDLLQLLLRGSHGDASWRNFDKVSNFFPKEVLKVQTHVQLAHDMKNTIPASSCFSFKNVDHVVFHVFSIFSWSSICEAHPLWQRKNGNQGKWVGMHFRQPSSIACVLAQYEQVRFNGPCCQTKVITKQGTLPWH